MHYSLVPTLVAAELQLREMKMNDEKKKVGCKQRQEDVHVCSAVAHQECVRVCVRVGGIDQLLPRQPFVQTSLLLA